MDSLDTAALGRVRVGKEHADSEGFVGLGKCKRPVEF